MPDPNPHSLTARSRRHRALGFAWAPFALLLASLVPGVSPAAAQPDIREIRPAVMLLIDSSGSMEYVGDCECTTLTCRECMTDCSDAVPARNRWANVLEVLTGEWQSYSCVTDPNRRGTGPSGTVYTGQYDEDYYLSHAVHPYGTPQADNGILDTYVDRVKFGLMTFDAHPTYTPFGALIPHASFNETLSDGVRGAFSYADSRGFHYFGCPDNNDRRVNSGARSETAASGRLVSVGFESAVSGVPSDDHTLINASIQSTLMAPDLRPHGATPVAAMLEDLEYYFSSHEDVRPSNGTTGDPYRECRQRFAILLTDGRPNMDFRGHPYYCEHDGGTDSGGVVSGGIDRCPYDTPENTASRLTSAAGPLDGLYVIGMNIRANDAPARTTLNAIATAGETCPLGGGDCARFPASASDLRVDFEEILRQTAPGTTTRTVPAFSAAGVGGGAQHQFQTGFNPSFSVVALGYEPWQGVLERRRFECNGLVPEAQPIDSTDRFHELLNTQGTRRLYTAVPPLAASINGHLVGPDADSLPTALTPPTLGTPAIDVSSGMTLFNASTIAAEYLGLVAGDNTRRDAIVAWTHGDAGTERADKRMGSIYHSSPVVIGAPGADRSDETFNEYRQLIGDRPRVVYVGTNDGILHAFLADDYDHDSGGATTHYTAGHEIWGFIPPILLDELEDTMTSHQWMLDGTPVIQDVITARTGTGSAADWRTVLVMGFRQGARGYFALDITDPFEPKFLWQYTHPQLGQTYGQPRMAQVNVEFPSGGIHQRTVAILPGGAGTELAGVNTPSDSRHMPETVSGIAPRGSRRNWATTGRALFVVDILTGKLIRHFDDFPSPLTGGVSVFPGSVGADAQAAYFNDHDGILWRLDLSSTDPDDWDYQAIWDMFHGLAADQGQPAYNSPILSTLEDGRVVIIQASGNVDLLEDGSAVNRVVSLTETINVNTTTFAFTGVDMTVNWDILNGPANSLNALRPGEQVTGPLELFNGVVYFGTFVTEVEANNACSFGYSRLWAVDYIEHVGSNLNEPVGRLPHPVTQVETVAFDHNVPGFQSLENGLLMGVGIAARPRCNSSDEPPGETDPYVGTSQTRHHVTNAAPPQFELVAQISGQGAGADGGAVATIGLSVTTPPIQVQTVGAVRRVE
ncbi:MAG: hypothetical protein IPG81_30365 [Sandaracinaceae bacterium]|nr:hypothetical protein [Sandaracinaceae bacterium]